MSEKRDQFPSPLVGEGREGGVGAGPSPVGAHTPLSSSPPQGGRGPVESHSHLSGHMRDGAHVLPIRVYYEDTDFSARVYHASYLRFMERGRTELLRAVAVAQSDLHAENGGLAFVVRRMNIDFLGGAVMDDVLTVVTRPKEMRGASMTLSQEVRRGDEVLISADVVVAAVRGGRAVRIPDDLRAALSAPGA